MPKSKASKGEDAPSASPRPITSPTSIPSSALPPSSASGTNTPSYVPIPNIPLRGAASNSATPSGASIQPRSFGTSFKPSSMSNTPIRRPSPKQSLEGLGKKAAVVGSLGGESGITARLAGRSSARTAGESGVSTNVNDSAPLSRTGSSNALRSDIIPPHVRSGDSTPASPALGAVGGGKDGESSFSNLADVPDQEKARVLGRHLMSAKERRGSTSRTPRSPGDASPAIAPVDTKARGGAESGISRVSQGSLKDGASNGGNGKGRASAEVLDSGSEHSSHGEGYGTMGESFHIPYDAPGVDTTHDLYKWQMDHRPGPQRSASFSHLPVDRDTDLDPSLIHIREPGGFRRNFVVNRAQEQGLERPTLVRNVVDFLFLYGHFAGEYLDEDEETDDDEEDEEEEDELDFTPNQLEAGHSGSGNQALLSPNANYSRAPFSRRSTRRTMTRARSGERQPLLDGNGTGPGTLSRGVSKTRHRRTKSGPPVGTASVMQAVLMLLKGFVGTGILFMGKAFFNGGLLFSTIVLLLIAAISLWAFLLLTKTYLVVPGSFGDMGGVLYGNWVRIAILASIAVSQIGFVAAYTIFIAQNLQAFILAVTDCRTFIEIRWLILAELVLFMPLAMIRNLAKLSGTALVADAFILIGIIYIVANESAVLAAQGLADVAMFNPHSFPLFIGTAVFTFEGIGLIIPITESMREPHKFPRALSGVMVAVSILFAGAGAMGYMSYGSKIQTVVLVNLPQDDKFVQAVQFLYSIAILLSIPLQLFPAVRIMENGIFSRSGKHDPSVKWQKNIFRGAVVIGCSLLSWAGSKELDKFVSLIGSFACIPLCFIYPPMLHLKACAHTRTAKALDIGLLAFGIGICAFTTVQTIISLAEPSGAPPVFGKCQVPDGFY